MELKPGLAVPPEDIGTAVLPTAVPLTLIEEALVVTVTTVLNPILSGPDITPPPPRLTGVTTPPLEQALVVKVASLPYPVPFVLEAYAPK
jgi:hypothetical protein